MSITQRNPDKSDEKQEMGLLEKSCDFETDQQPKSTLYDVGEIEGKSKKPSCEICGRDFCNKYNLKRHMLRHEQKSVVDECDVCGKTFTSAYGMQQHIRRIHLRLKPYRCDICGKLFSSASDLHNHTRVHSKKVKCDICGKEVRNMKSHRTYHEKITKIPVNCDICGKAFKNNYILRGHMNIHLNNGKYECQICKKRVDGKIHFEEHLVTHTDARPYTCRRCGATYRYLSNLRMHYKRHESKESKRISPSYRHPQDLRQAKASMKATRKL